MPELIPVFVINLKRSTERRTNIENQLQQLGLRYEIIDATDGSTLNTEELKDLYDQEASLKYLKVPITKNEVACADSHLRIYEKMVREDIPYALVLEDDVALNKRITEVLSSAFLTKHTFDWLQIDYARVGWPFLQSWLKASWHNIKRRPTFIFYAFIKLPFIVSLSIFEKIRELSSNNTRVVKFARPLYLASAYVVTNEGARKLLRTGRPIRFAADMLPNKTRLEERLIMKAVCPPLAHQDKKFDSDIGIR